MSQGKLTLRAPPHLDFVQGYPGIPPSHDRPPAHLSGTVEIRPGPKPLFARYLHLELKKIETVPPTSASSAPGGGGNKFTELIGAGPTELWRTDAPAKGGKKLGWSQLELRDFAFQIPIPEGLPPSVAVDPKTGAGIVYHLHATLCARPKPKKSRRASAFFFGSSPPKKDGDEDDGGEPVYLTASAVVRIVKHDLHSPWPLYHPKPPEMRETSKGGITLGVTRFATAVGPGDELWTRVRVESELVRPMRILRFEISLREILRFRYGAPSGSGGGRTTDQRLNPVFEVHAKLNKVLYHKETHSFDIKAVVPGLSGQASASSSASSSQQKLTVTTGKHVTIEYLLKVRALFDTTGTGAGGVESGPEGGEIVLDWMPVTMGDRGVEEASRMVERIGPVGKMEPAGAAMAANGGAATAKLPLDRRSSQRPVSMVPEGVAPPPPPSMIASNVTAAGSRTGVGTINGPIGRGQQMSEWGRDVGPQRPATTGRAGAPGGRGGLYPFPEEVGYGSAGAASRRPAQAIFPQADRAATLRKPQPAAANGDAAPRGRDPRIQGAFPDRPDTPHRPPGPPSLPAGAGLPIHLTPDKGAGVVVDYGPQRSARSSLDNPAVAAVQRMGLSRTSSSNSVTQPTPGEGGSMSVQERIQESKRRLAGASISRPSSRGGSTREASPARPAEGGFLSAEEEKKRLYERAKAEAEVTQAGAATATAAGSGGSNATGKRWVSAEEEKKRLFDEARKEADVTQARAKAAREGGTKWASAEDEKKRLFENAKREAEESQARVQGGSAPSASAAPATSSGWPSAEEEKRRLFEAAKREADDSASWQQRPVRQQTVEATEAPPPSFESAEEEKRRYEMARRTQEEAERRAWEYHSGQSVASPVLPYETRPAPLSPKPMYNTHSAFQFVVQDSPHHVSGSSPPKSNQLQLTASRSSSSAGGHHLSTGGSAHQPSATPSPAASSQQHEDPFIDPQREAYLKAVAEREAFVSSKTGSPVISAPQKLAFESALEEKQRLRKEHQQRQTTASSAPNSPSKRGYDNLPPLHVGLGRPPMMLGQVDRTVSSRTASSGYQRDPGIKAGKAKAVESEDSHSAWSPTDEPGYIPWRQQQQPSSSPVDGQQQRRGEGWLDVRTSTPFDMSGVMAGMAMSWSNSEPGVTSMSIGRDDTVRRTQAPPPVPPKVPF